MGNRAPRFSIGDAPSAALARWPAHGLAEPNPFYGNALLGPALIHLREQPVHVVEPLVDGVPVARLPVTVGRQHGRARIAHCLNWMHHHCFYGAPLLLAGREEEGWRALLAVLDAAPWSGHFLHLRGVDADGPAFAALERLCAVQGRRLDLLESHQRALLHSNLDADGYWAAHVRAKKRKELRRLQARLAEEGPVQFRVLTDPAALREWLERFIRVEQSGWKGEHGTALGSNPADSAFLHAACANAMADGRLDLLRLDCGAQTIAMLVNFTGADGGYSFKIAIDTAFARFSPGVLIEQANLARVLDDKVAPWMDSCAAPDHPMIDSLWGERRMIGQYRIGLLKPGRRAWAGRKLLPALAATERAYHAVKRRKGR